MKHSSLTGAVCAVVLMFTIPAAVAGTFNVLSGSFDIFDTTGLHVGGVTLTGNGVLVEGLFDGSAAAFPDADPTATFAGFEVSPPFLGIPFWFYYAATGVDGVTHAAPSIDFNSMTADLGSLYVFWNVQSFNVGGIAAVTQTGTNTWGLEITHTQLEGPFPNFTSVMHMEVSQVPVPAAIWLFCSGILGLFGIARYRRAQ